MEKSTIVYLLLAAGVIYLIRMLPLTLIRREIKSTFFRSFLYYVPYVTLAAMTFPAILSETASPVSGAAALVVGLLIAFFDGNLFRCAVGCCGTVLLVELFL